MNVGNWKISYDPSEVPNELLDAGFSPLLCRLLLLRGIRSAEDAKSFLSIGDDAVADPFLLTDMDLAVGRISRAIEAKEKVAVFGDYDVDGITSTSLLTHYLRSRGLDVTPYIPDRTEEGYGLNYLALRGLSEKGITLVITVDCGITAAEETDYARTYGVDMIITDHHECKPDVLPNAVAVIDCKRPGDRYPYKYLAGVGTAYRLVAALEGSKTALIDLYCDLVAIGTVSDVMPLTGENRYYVVKGLDKMRSHPSLGIAALMRDAGVNPSSVSANSISFALSPRLNAAGRLNQALKAMELLTSRTPEDAARLSKELCALNQERQDIEALIWRQASAAIGPVDPDGPIVLASEEWHQGVIGIAASRLADAYKVPAIMINLNGEIGKGSCRSYGNFNLFEALWNIENTQPGLLVSFGGHALAAGLNISRIKIDEFREVLREYYHAHKPETPPEVVCDLLITDPSLLSLPNVRSLSRLEPLGNGNPKPVMCMTGVPLTLLQPIGGGKHSKLMVELGGVSFPCVFFSHAAEKLEVRQGDLVDIAFSPQVNEFRGQTSVQLVLSAIRRHDSASICTAILNHPEEEGFSERLEALLPYLPDRNTFGHVWKSRIRMPFTPADLTEFLRQYSGSVLPELYCLCLEVFYEAGLLSAPLNGDIQHLSGKADLNSTPIMKYLHDLLNNYDT